MLTMIIVQKVLQNKLKNWSHAFNSLSKQQRGIPISVIRAKFRYERVFWLENVGIEQPKFFAHAFYVEIVPHNFLSHQRIYFFSVRVLIFFSGGIHTIQHNADQMENLQFRTISTTLPYIKTNK